MGQKNTASFVGIQFDQSESGRIGAAPEDTVIVMVGDGVGFNLLCPVTAVNKVFTPSAGFGESPTGMDRSPHPTDQ